MDAQIYVWIEGENFLPKDFQSMLDSTVSGDIAYVKKLEHRTVKQTREHWKSPRYETTSHNDAVAKLHDLLTQLRPALLAIKDETTTVCAEIVCHYSGYNEAHGGVYLPKSTIALLSEVGASLDVDEYYDSGDEDEPS